MYKIKITAQGANNKNGVYIGRPSYFQNPFPTKFSKFSNKIYSHKESMSLYSKAVQKIKVKQLVKQLYENKEITLNCFCINKTYNSMKELPKMENAKCHGEILAKKIYEELELYIKEQNNINNSIDNSVDMDM